MIEVGMREHAKNGGRDRLHEEMTVRVKDVEAVTPHVAFSDEGRSKPDSPMTAKVKSRPVVWIYIPAVNRRGLQKNNVPLRNEFGQMRHDFVL